MTLPSGFVDSNQKNCLLRKLCNILGKSGFSFIYICIALILSSHLYLYLYLLTTDGGNEERGGEVITRSPLGRVWDCRELSRIQKIPHNLTFTNCNRT